MESQRGFTLLELIVVVLVFGFMSAMAYGGLSSVLKTRASIEASMARTAELQKAYQRLRNDFQNLANRSVRDNFGEPQPALRGEPEQGVEFTRGGWRNPLYLPRGSLERVAYSLRDGVLERASYRVLDRAQDSEPVRLPLLGQVTELRWRYLDSQREWTEQWPVRGNSGETDAQAPPPLAVELTLVTRDLGELRFVFKPGAEPAPAGLEGSSFAPTTPSGQNATPPSQASDGNVKPMSQ